MNAYLDGHSEGYSDDQLGIVVVAVKKLFPVKPHIPGLDAALAHAFRFLIQTRHALTVDEPETAHGWQRAHTGSAKVGGLPDGRE
jgi:hypothetical protein